MTLLINKHTFEVIDYDDKSRIAIVKNTKEWLKIPEGANLATQSPDNQITFWKDDHLLWNINIVSWEDSRPYALEVGNSAYYNYWKHKIVWDYAKNIDHKNSVDRNAHLPGGSAHTYEAVPEDPKNPCSPMVAKNAMADGWNLAAVPDTIYHYAASYNTHRGTTYYDGVVSFPGRITGIEDYRKVRAQIAEDGHVTADRVNVHSLTVIG